MATVSDLLLDIGRAKAAGELGGGEAWGNAVQQLGQIPGQSIAQMRQGRAQQQDAQIRQQQIDTYTQNQAGLTNANQVVAQHLGPDGLPDLPAITKSLADANVPLAVQTATLDHATRLYDIGTKARQDRVDRQADVANTIIDSIDKKIDPWVAVASGMSVAKNAHIASDQELGGLTAQLIQAPDASAIRTVLENVRQLSPKYAPKLMTLAGTPEGGAPAKIVSISPSGQATDVAVGSASQPKTAPVTGAEEDSRYRQLEADVALKKPVSAADLAWAGGYEKQKTLGVDATASAAMDRQTRTLQQQIEQQGRAQTFSEQQAGRAELTNKIEQPYLDAKEKASTLRSVIDAAKNGNMEAASVQSLMGTLGLVTMEGVKRINTTELDQVAGAGSLLERIKSRVGGLVAGKPLSDSLQKDLGQLSDLLEKSARAKYEDGFKATTQRYKLNDELMLPASASAAPAAPTAPKVGEERVINGVPAVWTTINGQSGWKAK